MQQTFWIVGTCSSVILCRRGGLRGFANLGAWFVHWRHTELSMCSMMVGCVTSGGFRGDAELAQPL